MPHSGGDFKERRSLDIWRRRARRKGAVIRHGMDDGPFVPYLDDIRKTAGQRRAS